MKRMPIILLLGVLSAVLVMGLVSAAIEIATPASGTNQSGSITVNFTYTNVTDITSPVDDNTTWYYDDSAITVSSFACNSASCTATWDTSGVSDASSKVFSVIAGNDTDTAEADTNSTSVTVDNTAPSCSSSRTFPKVERLKSQTLTCTCTDGIDSDPTITRTLTKTSGETVSPTTSPYTATGTDNDEIGESTWDCSASDFTGNSGSATQLKYNVVGSDDASADTTGTDISVGGLSSVETIALIAGASILLIVAIAWWMGIR